MILTYWKAEIFLMYERNLQQMCSILECQLWQGIYDFTCYRSAYLCCSFWIHLQSECSHEGTVSFFWKTCRLKTTLCVENIIRQTRFPCGKGFVAPSLFHISADAKVYGGIFLVQSASCSLFHRSCQIAWRLQRWNGQRKGCSSSRRGFAPGLP